MQKILLGDQVYVCTGKDKGKTGVVIKVLKSNRQGQQDIKLVIEGINLASKHIRGNPNQQTTSRIEKKPMPVDYSNVAIYNVATGKPDRIKLKILADGQKVRVYRSTGEEIQNNVPKRKNIERE